MKTPPKPVRLADLTPNQRALVLALIEAGKPTAAPEPARVTRPRRRAA